MPVLIDIDLDEHHLASRAQSGGPRPTTKARTGPDCLEIGLVNNMPDAALMATERQLFDLLSAAAGKLMVRLHFYTMQTTLRSEWGRDYVRRYYRGTDDLLNGSLDGIIVTGTEPKATSLMEEPYWPTFVELLEWAKENTASSVYSCLAVHGAVLHMDGVPRHALPAKCIGVFGQTKTNAHPLMHNVPAAFGIPHARWNEVQETDLAACGYSVLTRSAEAGVDCFVKQTKKSLFVHFQGHPEYETQSLLGEYRRDMGRFLRGENEVCPTIPKGYFDTEAEEIVTRFSQRALSERSPDLFTEFPTDRLTKDLRSDWRVPATQIYRNWLRYMASQRAERSRRSDGARPLSRVLACQLEGTRASAIVPSVLPDRTRPDGTFLSQREFELVRADPDRTILHPYRAAAHPSRGPLTKLSFAGRTTKGNRIARRNSPHDPMPRDRNGRS